ncbi:MAG: C25 family cysteine peptidase [Acidobacteriota bacterium]
MRRHHTPLGSIFGILTSVVMLVPAGLQAGPCDTLPAGGTLSGIVNSYYQGRNSPAAGATSVRVYGSIYPSGNPAIAAGDMLLIMQMQDADINASQSNLYGDGVASDPANGQTNLNRVGYFEYLVAQSAVSGAGWVDITGAGAGNGLLHSYRQSLLTATPRRTWQLMRVPRYRSATLSSTLTALLWDGAVGGVLAIDVSGTLTLGGTVSVDGLGFAGGGGRQLTGDTGASTDYRTVATNDNNGAKGESIAGTPRYVFDGTIISDMGVEGYTNGSNARGAPGNAGGGGTDGNPAANDENSGGAGGGNGGLGGRGGRTWNSDLDRGGHQGATFPYATGANARIAMGGGGGAGTRNNSPTIANASSGGPGGGTVLIRAYEVTGTGTITANGRGRDISGITPENDGGGGGGAGGTVVVVAPTGTWTGLTVQARGGGGADAWPLQAPGSYPGARHGPGGGGGGGVVLLSSGSAGIDVSGGVNGTTTTALDAFGATPGSTGVSQTAVTLSDIPGVRLCDDPNAPTWARIMGVRVNRGGFVEFATASQFASAAFNIYQTSDPFGQADVELISNEPVPANPLAILEPEVYRVNTRPINEPFILIEEIECGGTTRMLGPFPVESSVLARQLELVEQRLAEKSLPARTPVPQAGTLIERGGAVTALKLEVSRVGIVRVPVADLVAAGLPAEYAATPEQLRLTNLGQVVGFNVLKDAGGAATIEFVSTAFATDYSSRNVYVVTWGAATAPAPSVHFTKSGFAEFPGGTRVEQNLFYAPFIAQGGDPWVWNFLSTWFPPDELSFDLPSLAAPPAGSIPVRIGVVGGTDHTHTIEAWINGNRVGQVSFRGKTTGEIWGEIPGGALNKTGNKIAFVYSADVSGPTDGALAFIDVVDMGFPLAAPTDEVHADRIAPYNTDLSLNPHGTEYLIATHGAFGSQAEQIGAAKRGKYRVSVVNAERAYDRFSSGVVEPNAIKSMIAEIRQANRRNMKYVLLVGDDTYDPRDFMGRGHVSFIPSLNGWDDVFGRVPSENKYADTDGDGSPELAIGRLPVSTVDEAQAMADKITSRASAPVDENARRRHIIAVDNQGPTDPSFYQAAAEAANHLPSRARLVWANIESGADQARSNLLYSLKSGAQATHFFGHGSFEIWSDDGLLAVDDAATLAGSRGNTVLFTWTCEVQWYQLATGPTINEALLLLPKGGAIASVGPTGITDPTLQRTLYVQLYDNLGKGMTLGEALREAKEKALRSDAKLKPVVDGWSLLGDPSLELSW